MCRIICTCRSFVVPLHRRKCTDTLTAHFAQCKRKENMEKKDFRQFTDDEFKAALQATINLKREWMSTVDKREKELGLR